MWRFRRISKPAPNKKGQAVVEYVLLLACIGVLSVGFAKFVGDKLFTDGLEQKKLPKKVSICVSHGRGLTCE
jgi:Flp pilus assembly pilin Flp